MKGLIYVRREKRSCLSRWIVDGDHTRSASSYIARGRGNDLGPRTKRFVINFARTVGASERGGVHCRHRGRMTYGLERESGVLAKS